MDVLGGPTRVFGAEFQNPVLLASGTCGFGRELADVVELDSLGGIVTKSVTPEPRWGNPAPRVAEVSGGMLNSVGLANPGLEVTRREKLPWLRNHLRRARVLVSVAGHDRSHYAAVVDGLDDEDGFLGFEINLSCPNDARLSGLPFALDADATAAVVRDLRRRTQRPLVIKLAPNAPDLAALARVAVESGADGLTVSNTLPGLALDDRGRPRLGAGPGGLSGPALRPVALAAVQKVADAVAVPVLGAGGIGSAEDARAYLAAGASLVQVGTASFADPRTAGRVVQGLRRSVAGPSRPGR